MSEHSEQDEAKQAFNPEAYLTIDTFRRYLNWAVAHEVSDNAPKPQESITENLVSTKPGSNVNSQPAFEDASTHQHLPLAPKKVDSVPKEELVKSEHTGEIGYQELLGEESPARTTAVLSTAQKDRLSPTTSKSAFTATAEKLTSASPESIERKQQQARGVQPSCNLAKRMVHAKEPEVSYNEALKREEIQKHHDSQHLEDERNIVEMQSSERHQERSVSSDGDQHEATAMVDNSSCYLEDTQENMSSQGNSQPHIVQAQPPNPLPMAAQI